MKRWKHADAGAAIARLSLMQTNAAIADYWLSLWDGDRPPTRASFNPMRIASHLPSVALIAVRPGEDAVVRLAGDYFRLATGCDLTGRSLLDFVSHDARAARIRNVTDIVMGTIQTGKRAIRRGDGSFEISEELCLPFADISEDGTRRYLIHSSWRADTTGITGHYSPYADCGLPSDIAKSPIAPPDAE